MQKIQNKPRFFRLINESIHKMNLNLSGLSVLTEAASGSFICTALTAAKAGAEVTAVTRSSEYGSAAEVIKYGEELAFEFGVNGNISFIEESGVGQVNKIDIVTNLGFVRPINEELIKSLPVHAVISLMWEPWEIREEDIDLNACVKYNIPVIGTNEHNSLLNTFNYVGLIAIKLLLMNDIEVYSCRIGLIASDPFGSSIEKMLKSLQSNVMRIDTSTDLNGISREFISTFDALVVAEHNSKKEIIGNNEGISPGLLKEMGVKIIHISGTIDKVAMDEVNMQKYPPNYVRPGFMTLNTAFVGPKPVIDLHTAGLRVGEISSRKRLSGFSVAQSIRETVNSGFGVAVPNYFEIDKK